MHPRWASDLLAQCRGADVPFFFKQWGEWIPTEVVPGGDLGGDMRRGVVEQVRPFGEIDGHWKRGDVYMRRVGKKNAGRLLDGVEHSEYPTIPHVRSPRA
jgi:protein gp37